MTTPTNLFAFPKPTDTDPADLPTQIGNVIEQIEDRLQYAGAQGGKSINDASQNITSNTYALAGTPDRVQGLIVPADGGLIVVRFSGIVTGPGGSSVLTAAIHITRTDTGPTTTQLKVATAAAAPALQEVSTLGAANSHWLYTAQAAGGLAVSAGGAVPSDVNTGMTVPGGPIVIERLAAGTYDVDVRYKVTAGTGSAQKRRLHAWAKAFPSSGV